LTFFRVVTTIDRAIMMETHQYNIRLSDGREFGPAPMELLAQWAREGRIPIDAHIVDAATREMRPVLAEPALQSILQAPPTVSTGLRMLDNGPGSVLIPTKNPAALTGYYIAVFSIIAGPLLGIPAVILGVIGLRNRSRNPQIHGAAHAWVAIILGGLITLGWAAAAIALLMSV
jgi:hypothetical protein